jgi:phosphate-selective porin
MRIFSILFSLLLLASIASAESFSVTGNGANRTITVKAGDSVSVLGNENKIIIRGFCQSIEVTGNENSLDIQANYGKISVIGNQNSLLVNKLEPSKILNLGSDNQIQAHKPAK